MDLPGNRTLATEVVLLGFTRNVKINLVLFFLFLVIYIVTLFGNGFMVLAIIFSSHLHTPMYFFLCNLAFVDFFYSSSTVLKLLGDLLSSNGKTSIPVCAIQVYIGLFLGGTKCILLVLMAYDRYVAICKPLYYSVLMRWSVCYRLAALVWISSFMTSVLPSLLMPMRLCNPNQLNHFVCEVLVVVKLSCDNTKKNELAILFISFISLLFPFVFILLSYGCILASVLKIHAAGMSKAFSIVVVMFYGTALIMYCGPSSKYSPNFGKYISVFYAIIIPMLNPLIYSLKNKEVTKIFLTKKNFCAN